MLKKDNVKLHKENIYQEFIKYVSLNMLSMLALSLYILADTFFIANGVGNHGLVALNLVLPVYSFLNGAGLLLGIGGATRFAIAKGQGEKERYSQIFMQVIYIALFFGTVFTVIILTQADSIVKLLGASDDIVPFAKTYLITIMSFSVAFLLNNILVCFVRNDDNPKLAMKAMLTASFSNIILDYIFVFPCKMGMFGAAFATGLAPIFSMCVLSVHFMKKKNHFHFMKCRIFVTEIKNILLVGIPSFITEFSTGIIMLLFNIVILGISGNPGLGAYGIISNIAIVCISLFTGVAQGIQPILSTNFGAGRTENIKKIYHMACGVALVLGCIFYISGILFPEQIIHIFNKDKSEELADIARKGIRLYFITFLFAGINVITAAYFACTEKAKNALLISSLRGFLFIIPLILILPAQFGMTGVWLCVPFAEILTLIVGIVCIRKLRAASV